MIRIPSTVWKIITSLAMLFAIAYLAAFVNMLVFLSNISVLPG